MAIQGDDLLYRAPALREQPAPDERERFRQACYEHLLAVIDVHGRNCPNCNMDLTTVGLRHHRALSPGVCLSQWG